MQIKESWKNNTKFDQNKIEMIPTSWLWDYWGRDVSPMADLMDGTPADMDALWENILKEGMHNPLIMRIGLKNKKFRLESGNHRIQLFHQHGVEEVPVIVQVREECGPHVGDVMTDASHNFDFGNEVIVPETAEEYLKPSEVFKSLQI